MGRAFWRPGITTVMFMMIAVLFFTTASHAATWNRNVAVTPKEFSVYTEKPAMVVDATGVIHIAYVSALFGDVYYCKSTDNGATWSTPVMVSDSAAQAQFRPDLAVDLTNSRIYVTWMDRRESAELDCYYTWSTDGGATWSADAQLNDDEASPNVPQRYPSLEVDSTGKLFASWSDSDRSPAGQYFWASENFGASWIPDPSIKASYYINAYPENPIMFWQTSSCLAITYYDSHTNGDQAVWFTKSCDGGANWDAVFNMVHPATDNAGEHGSSPDSTGAVYVAYTFWNDLPGDTFTWNIAVVKSNTGGQDTWSTPIRLDDYTGAIQRYFRPTVAAPDSIFVAYSRQATTTKDIYVTESSDHGSHWSTPQRINDDTANYDQDYAVLAKGLNGVAHLAWIDKRDQGVSRIYYSTTGTLGSTAGPAVPIGPFMLMFSK